MFLEFIILKKKKKKKNISLILVFFCLPIAIHIYLVFLFMIDYVDLLFYMFKCMVYLFVHPHNPIFMQTETIDLSNQSNRSERSQRIFRRSNVDKSMHSLIDSDGLPYVGQVGLLFFSSSYFRTIFFFFAVMVDHLPTDFQMIRPNEPYCCIYDEVTSSTKTNRRKGSEPVIVDYVAVDVKNEKRLQKVIGYLSSQ
jgi:hypothetical protein